MQLRFSRVCSVMTCGSTCARSTAMAGRLVRGSVAQSSPVPSWPKQSPEPTSLLEPQHQASPVSLSAQECCKPVLTCWALKLTLDISTRVGVGLGSESPLPSWPPSLAPQQKMLPSPKTAQLCCGPALSDAMHVASPH